jgi:hypothetical protein
MPVLIKSMIPTWEDLILDVGAGATVEQLKNLIAEAKGIPVQVIRLYLEGLLLEDADPASELEVVYLGYEFSLPL